MVAVSTVRYLYVVGSCAYMIEINMYFILSCLYIKLLLIYGVSSNNCITKQTCGECIAEGPQCAWCWKNDISENDVPLCDYRENLEKQRCENIVNPENSISVIKDRPLSDKRTDEEAVQIKPQEIRIKLRPNFVQKFKVQFRQAVDHPTDLYYHMDLPSSMKDVKEELDGQGNNFSEAIRSIKSNFRMGFRSFVEKTVAPDDISDDDKLKQQSVVEMTHESDSNIKLSYKSRCLGAQLENTNICRGLKAGANVTFEIALEYSHCPSDRSQREKTFSIYPVGFQDHLTIHLEMICECDCEKYGKEEVNSRMCSLSGTFECGICNCNKSRYGKFCECAGSPVVDENDSGCFNGDDNRPCSGVGICICNQCECFRGPNPEEVYYGKFCECDNFSCNKKDGKICNGPDHGICICGICLCHAGWKGNDCSCRDGLEEC